MVKLLIAFDEQDEDFGKYFTSCKDDLLVHATNCGLKEIVCFDGNNGNPSHITDHISSLNEISFIFVSYAQGNSDSILLNSQTVVNSQNAYFFGKSLFYACSCKTGEVLGKQLVEAENCRAFVGFKDDIFLARVVNYHQLFIECENFGIKHFLNGDSTLANSFNEMRSFFDEKIDFLLSEGRSFDASILLDNKNSLILLPENSDCTLADFNLTLQE